VKWVSSRPCPGFRRVSSLPSQNCRHLQCSVIACRFALVHRSQRQNQSKPWKPKTDETVSPNKPWWVKCAARANRNPSLESGCELPLQFLVLIQSFVVSNPRPRWFVRWIHGSSMLLHMRGAIALFCCSLIAVLGACGGKMHTEGSATVASCTYNDRQYPAGSSFSPDSCNTCNCTSDGEAYCTHRTCTAPVDAGAGGSSGSLACAGYALDAAAVDASTAISCLNTFLLVAADAGAEVPCSWDMPIPTLGNVIQPDQIQFLYLPDAGGTREIPLTDSVSGCSDETGGWYFDNPRYPLTINPCPCTCALANSGRFMLIGGCPRIGSIIE